MLIDWFTVIAQAVNFLILLWLLKRFLYQPIINAINERENRIKNQIEEAETKMAEAEKQREEYERKNDDFEKQKEFLKQETKKEVSEIRKNLLEEARREAGELRKRIEESFKEEQQNLQMDLVQRMHQEIYSLAQKIMTDLASIELEEQIVRVFIQQLNNLDQREHNLLIDALKNSRRKATIKSAFELSKRLQDELTQLIHTISFNDISISFETDPWLISGIEFISGGHKISWNIMEYLTSLENRVNDLLKETTDFTQGT